MASFEAEFSLGPCRCRFVLKGENNGLLCMKFRALADGHTAIAAVMDARLIIGGKPMGEAGASIGAARATLYPLALQQASHLR